MKLKATILATAGFMTATVPGVSQANSDQCFDFSSMDENASYNVGDVIDTRLATITVSSYIVDGEPATASTRGAKRAQSQIAGGPAPELELKQVALVIEPKEKARRITMQIAQNMQSGNVTANSGIAVNRKGSKSKKGFAGFDGKVLGRPASGKARITADLAPHGSGNWHSGTLSFDAVQGSIHRVRLGGHTVRLDNVCFVPAEI